MFTVGPLAMSIPFISELLILSHFAELVECACWAPDGQEWQYFRDNFYAKVVVRSSREIWRATWIFWPLPTVHLEPLHQQAKYHCERESYLKRPQHVASKAPDEANVETFGIARYADSIEDMNFCSIRNCIRPKLQ